MALKKNKYVAGALGIIPGIFFGVFGLHALYLGKIKKGLILIFLTIVLKVALVYLLTNEYRITPQQFKNFSLVLRFCAHTMAILMIMDVIKYMKMDNYDFDMEFNEDEYE